VGAPPVRRVSHALESALLRAVAGALGLLPRPLALASGGALGSLARGLGVRREVARANLAIAFPDRDERWRARVLAEHYRELGRVAADYPRLPALVHGPRERAFAAWRGEEHLHAARARGRGVLLLTGHFGNFELGGAAIGRLMPVAFLVKPLSNPGAEAWLSRLRTAAGVDQLPIGAGVRGALRRLRAGGAVALLGDQDARKDGVWVPFMGRPASTPAGPAWLSLASGAPIVFGSCVRAPDGRYEARYLPPIVPEGSADDPRAIEALTRRHTALLEGLVRERPESWFWLHRRWKTAPPAESGYAPATRAREA
jgi:KDO2-lipid IV(A) lauroyltransferase